MSIPRAANGGLFDANNSVFHNLFASITIPSDNSTNSLGFEFAWHSIQACLNGHLHMAHVSNGLSGIP